MTQGEGEAKGQWDLRTLVLLTIIGITLLALWFVVPEEAFVNIPYGDKWRLAPIYCGVGAIALGIFLSKK